MIQRNTIVITAAWISLAVSQSAFAQGARFSSIWTNLQVQVPSIVTHSTNLGHADPNRKIHVTLSIPYGDPAGVKAYADSVSDPVNLNYRQFLTPDQVGSWFGLPSTRVQALASYLSTNGMQVTLVAKNRLNVLADGTVAQAEKAFRTVINNYKANDPKAPGNVNFYSFSKPLQMPSDLARDVLDVSGLESFTKPHPRGLTASQTRVLYNLAPAYDAGYRGQGRTVAISNWDGYLLSNVPIYYTAMSLPPPGGGVGSNITVVPINGGSGSGGAAGEGDLDIQMVLGMAPLCNFYIYDGGGDLNSVLTVEANDNKADVISESYGWFLPGTTAEAAHNIHLSMTAQGITYMAASGDNGTSLEPYSYPNYDGEVLMVGGTVAVIGGLGVRISEVGWSGSGGGWSNNATSFNHRPTWQKGTGVPTNVDRRLSPDVAAHAASPTGAYQYVYNGVLVSDADGTSFASPVYAGSLAVVEQKLIALGGLPAIGGHRRLGRVQNVFYSENGKPDVWFDITQGNNGILPDGSNSSCTTKWDFVTGWGATNFDKLVTNLLTQSKPGKDVAPNAIQILQGTYVSGSLANVVAGTGSGYRTHTVFLSNIGYSTIDQVSFNVGTSSLGLSRFDPTFRLSGASGVPVIGQIYLWNRLTSVWELTRSVTVPTDGTTMGVTFSVQSGLNKYVANNGTVKAAVRLLSPIGRRGLPGAPFTGALRFAKLAYFPL